MIFLRSTLAALCSAALSATVFALLTATTSQSLVAQSCQDPEHGHSHTRNPAASDSGGGPEEKNGKQPSRDTTKVFGQAELEVMVREILAIAPENAAYRYPVEIKMIERDKDGKSPINACAGYELREGVRQAVLYMYRGLVDVAAADQRILRAVIAHEVAHLVLGHAVQNPGLQDVHHHHVRQEERAADELGASYLEQLGHDREDMIDMLQMLDRCNKERRVPWIVGVAGDHASCMTRASYLVPNDKLLAAVSRYEIGLLFMECRRFAEALQWFDEALKLQPDLHEAELNGALAALQDYYDRLPAAVHDAWLRPVFGPMLTDARALAGRAIEVTAEDQARYDAAVERISALPVMHYDSMRRFLAATADVLHPGGEAATLGRGVTNLSALRKVAQEDGWQFGKLKPALANNLALGLARQGESVRAAALLVSAQRIDMKFLPALSENFARVPLSGLGKDDAKLALNSMAHLIKLSPKQAPAAAEARDAILRECKRRNWTFNAPEQPLRLAWCSVATLKIGEDDIALFDHFSELNRKFGKYGTAAKVDPLYDSLYFAVWGEREVIALVENNRLVKMTSYVPGSSLTLLPRRRGAAEPQHVTVGMTEADFDALIGRAGTAQELRASSPRLLDVETLKHLQGEEPDQSPGTWRYYPTLNFGVLLKAGKVAAITVTPVK